MGSDCAADKDGKGRHTQLPDSHGQYKHGQTVLEKNIKYRKRQEARSFLCPKIIGFVILLKDIIYVLFQTFK